MTAARPERNPLAASAAPSAATCPTGPLRGGAHNDSSPPRDHQIRQRTCEDAKVSGMSADDRRAEGVRLSVMLIVADADAAVGWYETALGARELWNLGGVAGLHLDGAPFFVHEAVPGKTGEPSPTDVGLTTTRIEVFVDDPARLIDHAADAGARDVERPVDHEVPWGTHLQGGFTDPFGHRWSVGDRSPLGPLAGYRSN